MQTLPNQHELLCGLDVAARNEVLATSLRVLPLAQSTVAGETVDRSKPLIIHKLSNERAAEPAAAHFSRQRTGIADEMTRLEWTYEFVFRGDIIGVMAPVGPTIREASFYQSS